MRLVIYVDGKMFLDATVDVVSGSMHPEITNISQALIVAARVMQDLHPPVKSFIGQTMTDTEIVFRCHTS